MRHTTSLQIKPQWNCSFRSLRFPSDWSLLLDDLFSTLVCSPCQPNSYIFLQETSQASTSEQWSALAETLASDSQDLNAGSWREGRLGESSGTHAFKACGYNKTRTEENAESPVATLLIRWQCALGKTWASNMDTFCVVVSIYRRQT